MAEALVNHAVLKWARERAELPLDALARKIGTDADKVAAWECGVSRPTFRQAEKLAQATHVPFGYLFLPEPPGDPLPIADLRASVGAPPPHLDANFLDTLRDVQFKLDWYRAYRIEHGHDKLPFVGRFNLAANPAGVAEDMRRTLGLHDEDQGAAGSMEEYFRLLVSKAEAVGIWVMRNGVVGNNTRRSLRVEVFRGFAICDRVVPVVFVNSADAKAAQIFTLAHELAHVWIGASGVSDPFRTAMDDGWRNTDTEGFCNAVAAEFLAPRTAVEAAWDRNASLEANVQRLSRNFKVSRIVVAIRARHLGYVPKVAFEAFFESERRQWIRQNSERDGGGDFYRTARVRNGERFMAAVLASAMSGDLLLRNAGTLLGMSPRTLQEAYRRQRAGE